MDYPEEIFEMELDVESEEQIETDEEYPFEFNAEIASVQSESEEIEISDANVNSGTEKIIPEHFELKKIIGVGGYGKVFQVKKISGSNSNRTFAMKVVKKATLSIRDREKSKTERDILKDVRHPFIVELFYAFQTNGKLYLILEYLNGGDLFTHLSREVFFTEKVARFYAAEVILAVEHLHSLGIIYRDLKPENILLDSEGHVKLTDFGLSKQHIHDGMVTHTFCGTIEYMAPEVLLKMGYGKEVDWWSLGALLFDMLHGRPPFRGENRERTIQAITKNRLYFGRHVSADVANLIRKLLHKSPSKRLGIKPTDAEAIKNHSFFRNICWGDVFLRRLKPPMKPRVRSGEDVSQFDHRITRQTAKDTPDDGNLSESVNNIFRGFSYVAPSILEGMNCFRSS